MIDKSRYGYGGNIFDDFDFDKAVIQAALEKAKKSHNRFTTKDKLNYKNRKLSDKNIEKVNRIINKPRPCVSIALSLVSLCFVGAL